MTCRVVIPPEVEDQLRGADEWWQANRPLARDLFLAEFEAAVRLVSEMPGVGPRFRRATIPGVRRILLRRSRYWVYYLADEARQILGVLAVWSAHRGSDPPLVVPTETS